MYQIKRSLFPFLILLGLAFLMLDFGNNEIEYKHVTYQELPQQYKDSMQELGPGGTGMFSYQGNTYAFIATKPDKAAVIEYVGDPEDGFGKVVKYRVVQKKTPKAKIINGWQGDFALYTIQFDKTSSSSFGFRKID